MKNGDKPEIKIRSETATIETLQVSIKSIRINKKQMTLAVFRQLPIRRIINEMGELINYNYWGIVNYNIKDQGSLWVVFTINEYIFRACIDKLDDHVQNSVYNECGKRLSIYNKYLKELNDYQEKFDLYIKHKEKLISDNNYPEPDRENYEEYEVYLDAKTIWDEWIKENITVRKPTIYDKPDRPHLIRYDVDYEAEYQKAKKNKLLIDKWNASLKKLYTLDQLYIAV